MHKQYVYHGDCKVSGYDDDYHSSDDSDEDDCRYTPTSPLEIKCSDADLRDAIEDILSAMPVSSPNTKRPKNGDVPPPSPQPSTSPKNKHGRSSPTASSNAQADGGGGGGGGEGSFSFYSANLDDMDLVCKKKEVNEELQKLRSGTSPSVCPMRLCVEAWGCAGFLPRIPEVAEFDFSQEPRGCMSSASSSTASSRRPTADDVRPPSMQRSLQSIEEKKEDPDVVPKVPLETIDVLQKDPPAHEEEESRPHQAPPAVVPRPRISAVADEWFHLVRSKSLSNWRLVASAAFVLLIAYSISIS
eukprot:TRINITY_DN599_c0_g1_i1.p1 TRINITY_DN599_c0_g1~~TRINITY_DN599_c0_g1_i1.p1  ORF type:complete len:335 (-),score=62.83 TRINITY_DN599_c0_g1_i1:77-979(-)